jgi:hypothetical protein
MQDWFRAIQVDSRLRSYARSLSSEQQVNRTDDRCQICHPNSLVDCLVPLPSDHLLLSRPLVSIPMGEDAELRELCDRENAPLSLIPRRTDRSRSLSRLGHYLTAPFSYSRPAQCRPTG